MSSNSVPFNNGQQLQVNTNLAKLFPFEKNFLQYTFINHSYSDVTLDAGTVMGVVGSTGEIKPCRSTNTDGSQTPVGILGREYVVEGGDTATVQVMVNGWVRKDMLVFQGSETVETTVSSRRFLELLLAAGIFPQTTENNTNYENQY